MYLELMLLVILVMPLSVMNTKISRLEKPFATVRTGALYAAIGILLVFVLAFAGGHSLGAYMDKGIEKTVETVVGNKQALEALGMADLSKAKAISTLTTIYSAAAAMLPAMLMILGAVVSYIEYNILIRIRYRKMNTNSFKPFAYIRNFGLSNNDVMGWFIIYLISYILKYAGVEVGVVAVANINILVECIFAVQGLSVVFMFCKFKKIPKVVPVIVAVFMLMMPLGRTLLFTFGLLDLLLNLKKRYI